MKIRCCFNKLSDLKNKNISRWLKSECLRVEDEDAPIEGLVIGEEHQIYGMVFWNGAPMYYICDSYDDEYPVPAYFGFYEIVDPRFSQYWRLRVNISDNGEHTPQLVFKEWFEEDMFYENLLDGEEREVNIFKKYKKLMDREFEPSNSGPVGTKIWEFIDDEMPVSDFENWIYSENSLEKVMPNDLYMELVSFNYKDVDKYELPKLKDKLKSWVRKTVKGV